MKKHELEEIIKAQADRIKDLEGRTPISRKEVEELILNSFYNLSLVRDGDEIGLRDSQDRYISSVFINL